MQTPINTRQQIRTMRNHTPKLSERKKKLFATDKDNEISAEEEELLNGIEPLPTCPKLRNGNRTPKSSKVIEEMMISCKKSPRVISFFETESEDGDIEDEQTPSTSRRSLRLSLKRSPNSSKSETEFSASPQKENIPTKTPIRKEDQEAKQLQKMFNTSMQITPRNKPAVIEESSSEDETKRNPQLKGANKRQFEIEGSVSPLRKMAKITISPPKDRVSISTKCFYSAKSKILPNNMTSRLSCRNLFGQSQYSSVNSTPNSKPRQTIRRSLGSQSASINRGVRHKVRKRANGLGLGHKLAPVDIDRLLYNVKNEKLRKLITAHREEKQQIEKIHNIFRKASNPIAMARPLSSLSKQDDLNNNIAKNIHNQGTLEVTYHDKDFSDIECDTEADEDDNDHGNLEDALMAMNEEVIPLITHKPDDALSTESKDSSTVKKKFFKSGRTTSTRKEVHLTENIKATMTVNGKLAIISEKKKVKKHIKMRNPVANEFSDEQATVDAILRNLDDTNFGDVSLHRDNEENETRNRKHTISDQIENPLYLVNEGESSSHVDDCIIQDNQDFNEFRQRLPFNTSDPEIIERQHLLLDFLITNNICNEENFTIFIADPDNHKAEAERIVDELIIVVPNHQSTDFRQRIPYNTTDPLVIEQQYNFLDFLMENNICNEENFDIFIANYCQRKSEATAILSQYITTPNGQYTESLAELSNKYSQNNFFHSETNSVAESNNNSIIILPDEIIPNIKGCENDIRNAPTNCTSDSSTLDAQNLPEPQQKLFPVFQPGGCRPLPQIFTRRSHQRRLWNAGYGSNQYQIDAGQKEFGAHQCKQCGLVYTVHEPEEEKLHRDFHASLHILRFKGWIDEDIVAIYPEWGPDGRILRLTETSPPKRRDRLMDILKIVDKEIGFSSYIVPKIFVAYFAVRKMQIVGLCLVHPLDKAYKYMCVNDVDCCTDEQFEAKCGISRIWVSPLHRRFHIGSKLIQAVQLNTIFGEEVPLSHIAFSAPTELGKAFAQKITKNENFLVYQ